VRSSSQTNQHPVFTGRMPFLSPTNSVKAISQFLHIAQMLLLLLLLLLLLSGSPPNSNQLLPVTHPTLQKMSSKFIRNFYEVYRR